MTHRTLLAALLAVAVGGPPIASAQPPSRPQVHIVSPASDEFMSGLTQLRARVEPDGAASSLVFFVDGRQVCSVSTPPFQCDWDAGDAVRAHQVRAVANLSAGGRVVRTIRTRALGFAEKVDVDIVQVTVTVTDDEGEFVSGLPQSAFQVSEDDRPQNIIHFASEDAPLELIVAVDISGSMVRAMPTLKRAVKDFLGAVPEGNQVTLLGFNDTIFALTRKTTNPADRVRAVDRLSSWGSTALYDAIMRGTDMLGRQTGRKVLVVFTDGEDQGSHASLADLRRRLESSEVTLYMIGQGRGLTMEPLKQLMTELAEPTGGRALFTDNINELQAAFSELLYELKNQYLLGYKPTNTARDDTWRRITVEVEGQPHIRARQGYRAIRK
jgi:Ca-activated chloride channel family protein